MSRKNVVRLYILDPDNAVREVTDIREWNNRPKRLDSGPHIGVSGTVRRSVIKRSIEVFTMFHEMEVDDTPQGPFSTMFMAHYKIRGDRQMPAVEGLENAVGKQIGSHGGYSKAWTWDEAMSQHDKLVKEVREALKVLKTPATGGRDAIHPEASEASAL